MSKSDVWDVEGYRQAIKGTLVDPVQIGSGVGPSHVETRQLDRLVLTNSFIGFPMMTTGMALEDSITVVLFNSLPSDPTRWCEIPVEPRSVLVYGPGAVHTAINRPGLRFSFLNVPMDTLSSAATQLRVELKAPRAGEVQLIPYSPGTKELAAAFASLRLAAERPGPSSHVAADDAIAAVVRTLSSDDERSERAGSRTRIDSRRVVADCIEYAETIDRIPSVAELCLVAHVSARRLRQAFADVFELPPTRYFRLWALNRAKLRLQQAVPPEETVTNVAMRLGFLHLGRFAGHYKRVYEEAPSSTLRSDPSTGLAVSR